MTDLETRLADLGDALDLDEESVVDDVLARLDKPVGITVGHGGWVWLRVAALIVTVLVAVVAATPGSRRTVASWLGFDQVHIERRSDIDLSGAPVTTELPGPGNSRLVHVGGAEILVSAIDGRLDDGVITKSLGTASTVTEVDVAGQPGLWVDGAPHQVAYLTSDGDQRVVRAASNTLLWQDGAVLYRLEGFDAVEDAIAFAQTLEID